MTAGQGQGDRRATLSGPWQWETAGKTGARAPSRRHRRLDSPRTGGIKLALPMGTFLCTRCSRVYVQGETRQSETINTSSTIQMRRGEQAMYRTLRSTFGVTLCLLALAAPRLVAAEPP